MEVTALLLNVSERLLNAFAACIGATDPSEAGKIDKLILEYATARSEVLQHALNQSVWLCAQGIASPHTLNILLGWYVPKQNQSKDLVASQL